ncbi:MAG: cbb3-type cytochrome c oxidase subunit 3 [Pseudomonadota bacterium]
MMDYSTFREIADSWGLLYMVVLFVAVVIFTFRPGSKQVAEDVSMIPLKEDDPHVEK